MSLFWLPFFYSFVTRIKNISTKISFVITFFIPVLVLSVNNVIIEGNNINCDFFIAFILLFSGLFLVYEIGYIYNDFHTTLFEDNPTIRLNDSDIKTFKRSYPIHIAIRVFILIILLFLSNKYYDVNIFNFLFSLSIMNVFYSLHNFYRGNENLITIFLLLVFKYVSVPLAFSHGFNENQLINSLGFVLLFPLVRTIIFSTHKKISINIMTKNQMTGFRVIYFVISSMVLYLLCQVSNDFSMLLYMSLGFMAFYILGYIAEKTQS